MLMILSVWGCMTGVRGRTGRGGLKTGHAGGGGFGSEEAGFDLSFLPILEVILMMLVENVQGGVRLGGG